MTRPFSHHSTEGRCLNCATEDNWLHLRPPINVKVDFMDLLGRSKVTTM